MLAEYARAYLVHRHNYTGAVLQGRVAGVQRRRESLPEILARLFGVSVGRGLLLCVAPEGFPTPSNNTHSRTHTHAHATRNPSENVAARRDLADEIGTLVALCQFHAAEIVDHDRAAKAGELLSAVVEVKAALKVPPFAWLAVWCVCVW